MGDPKKHRKKYTTPKHPWQRRRIDEERDVVNGYGLKNKKEVWKAESVLGKVKSQAKSLIARKGQQSEKERKQIMDKLVKLNLIQPGAQIEDILALEPKHILNRRLQTVVYNKGLAKTISQARQFIVHGHIAIGSEKITVPSYLISSAEEDKIAFTLGSKLSNIEHPERIKNEKK